MLFQIASNFLPQILTCKSIKFSEVATISIKKQNPLTKEGKWVISGIIRCY